VSFWKQPEGREQNRSTHESEQSARPGQGAAERSRLKMPTPGPALDGLAPSFFIPPRRSGAIHCPVKGLEHSALEQTPWIREGLELEGVPRRVAEEERRLLPHLAGEADLGLDQELDPCRAQALDPRAPALHREHDPEVAHGHVVPVDHIGRERVLLRHVGRELVPEEVEIDPALRAAPDRTAQQARVEGARRLDVAHGEGEVEGRRAHLDLLYRDAYPIPAWLPPGGGRHASASRRPRPT